MWGCPVFFPFPGGGISLPALMGSLALLVAACLAVRAFMPRRSHRRGARADREDALRILRARLADGAISEEEFERLRRAVES